MENIKIEVYSKLNNIEENNEFLAIKNETVIKYIDLDNNKMMFDIRNNIIERENNDFLFRFDFNNNIIDIEIKKMNRVMKKDIKTLSISSSNKYFMVKYLLTDENIINEYYVKIKKIYCIK